MPDPARDAYETLGVAPSASDAELRSAYRRLVQLHHPDHNGGSPESARRFEAIREAYATVTALRQSQPKTARRTAQEPPRRTTAAPRDPAVESRIEELERELREAQQARERARQAARDAANAATAATAAHRADQARTADPADAADPPGTRPTDEELGYITTDDSFSKIFADARDELSVRFSEARDHPLAKRLADLIDELDHRPQK
jgi:curved DNA-binding protein CbpA